MIWFWADPHLGHANILIYAERPFSSLKEMNETLIRNYNSVVAKDDTVYLLGDLCFPKYISPELVLASLNGNITLIKGNHDKQPVLELFKGRWFKNLELPIVTPERTYHCILNHRPIYPKGTPDPFHDHDTSIDPDKYDFILSAHVHQKWKRCGKSINVGIDVWGYAPVSIEKIIDLFQE